MATGRVPTTANSPLTAKGDLFGYSTTQARVAVGSDGETLVADSSTSTGLRYTAGNPIPNPIIGSCFDVWQRGTSFASQASASSAAYSADRWQFYRGGGALGATLSRVATGDTTNLPFIQYAARLQRNSGNTSTASIGLYNSIETANSIPFAGKTITYSFYARKGADFSGGVNGAVLVLTTGTGTDQNVLTGYTGAASTYNGTTLTTSWQRFTFTGTVPATATQLGVWTYFDPTGTAGTNDYVDVTGFQIDIGSVALPIRRTGATIQGELAACQRYYWRQAAGGVYAIATGYGHASNTSTVSYTAVLPVSMRVAPTAIEYSGMAVQDNLDNLTGSLTSITISANLSSTLGLGMDITKSSAFTLGRTYRLMRNNNSADYIAASAEL
jgi:hypothetical protein